MDSLENLAKRHGSVGPFVSTQRSLPARCTAARGLEDGALASIRKLACVRCSGGVLRRFFLLQVHSQGLKRLLRLICYLKIKREPSIRKSARW